MADETIVQRIREYTHVWKIENFNYYLKLYENTDKTLRFTTSFSGLPLTSNGQNVKMDLSFVPAVNPTEKYWFSYRLYDGSLESFNFARIHFYIIKSNKEKYGEKVLIVRNNLPTCCIKEFCDNLTFIEKADDLLPNNTLTLGCDIICHFELISLKYERSFTKSQLDKQLSDILIDVDKKSDLKIIIEEEEFDIHMHILEARSKVFEKMFKRETREGKPNEVTISNVRPKIFALMLQFIYTNGVDVGISKDDTLDLWIAAEKYQLTNLQQICEELLFKMVNVNNVMDIYSLTERYEMMKLGVIIEKYIKICKAQIRKTISPNYFFKHPNQMSLFIDRNENKSIAST